MRRPAPFVTNPWEIRGWSRFTLSLVPATLPGQRGEHHVPSRIQQMPRHGGKSLALALPACRRGGLSDPFRLSRRLDDGCDARPDGRSERRFPAAGRCPVRTRQQWAVQQPGGAMSNEAMIQAFFDEYYVAPAVQNGPFEPRTTPRRRPFVDRAIDTLATTCVIAMLECM